MSNRAALGIQRLGVWAASVLRPYNEMFLNR